MIIIHVLYCWQRLLNCLLHVAQKIAQLTVDSFSRFWEGLPQRGPTYLPWRHRLPLPFSAQEYFLERSSLCWASFNPFLQCLITSPLDWELHKVQSSRYSYDYLNRLAYDCRGLDGDWSVANPKRMKMLYGPHLYDKIYIRYQAHFGKITFIFKF